MSERADNRWRGLLDPVNRSDQLPPERVFDPSRYLATNSNVGSGYNTLAQVLAQGQSPRVGQYYSPDNFRDPNRQLGNLFQYAPRQVTSQVGNNVPNNWQQEWQEWLRNRGVGRPREGGDGGNTGGTGGNTGGNAGGDAGGNAGNANWMDWLKINYPGVDWSNIGNVIGNGPQSVNSSMGNADPRMGQSNSSMGNADPRGNAQMAAAQQQARSMMGPNAPATGQPQGMQQQMQAIIRMMMGDGGPANLGMGGANLGMRR